MRHPLLPSWVLDPAVERHTESKKVATFEHGYETVAFIKRLLSAEDFDGAIHTPKIRFRIFSGIDWQKSPQGYPAWREMHLKLSVFADASGVMITRLELAIMVAELEKTLDEARREAEK